MDQTSLCPEPDMAALLELVVQDEPQGLVRLSGLLARWPSDPRLHFLEGSLKASNQDYASGARSMRRALDIAPEFVLARFQLGFLQLTSGEPFAAQESWGPLHGLPNNHFLRHFVEGLCHLIRDEFEKAQFELETGIAANTEVEPLNRDMMLIVEEIRTRAASIPGAVGQDEPVSATQMLLRQASLKATRH